MAAVAAEKVGQSLSPPPRLDDHRSFPQLLSLPSRFGGAFGSKAASPVPKGRSGKPLSLRCGFRLGRSKSIVERKGVFCDLGSGMLARMGEDPPMGLQLRQQPGLNGDVRKTVLAPLALTARTRNTDAQPSNLILC